MSIQVTPPINVEIKSASVMPFEEYEGEYEITASNSSQVLDTNNKVLRGNLVVNPDRLESLIEGSISGEIETDASSLRDSLFYNCTGITSIVAPNCAVTGNSTFTGATGLKKMMLGKITSITTKAKYDVSANIEEIDFPLLSSITTSQMWQSRTSLRTINLPALKTLNSLNGFYGCTAITELLLPNLVSSDSGIFRNATGLERLDIGNPEAVSPSSNPGLNSNCFQNCTSLHTIIVRHPYVFQLRGLYNFYNNSGSEILPSIQHVYVPEELVEAYKADSKWSAFASKISAIPEGV